MFVVKQVFPDKAQYPNDKEWEEDWTEGELLMRYGNLVIYMAINLIEL